MIDDYPPGVLAAAHAMRRVARCLGLPQIRPAAFDDGSVWCAQVWRSFLLQPGRFSGRGRPPWWRFFGWEEDGEGPRIFGRGDVPTDIRDRLDDALDGAFTARDQGTP